jgi:hypothetical protein
MNERERRHLRRDRSVVGVAHPSVQPVPDQRRARDHDEPWIPVLAKHADTPPADNGAHRDDSNHRPSQPTDERQCPPQSLKCLQCLALPPHTAKHPMEELRPELTGSRRNRRRSWPAVTLGPAVSRHPSGSHLVQAVVPSDNSTTTNTYSGTMDVVSSSVENRSSDILVIRSKWEESRDSQV